MALDNAGLAAQDIAYVNAHGTATDSGDISEVKATRGVLGHVPFSSLKGHLGHTLGACGGIEAWASLMMLNDQWFAPTLNLNTVDGQCEGVDHIYGSGREIEARFVMSNNFAFGGINTSLILTTAPTD